MADMLDIDRVSMGWNVWLTPRQTRVILCKMTRGKMLKEDKAELKRLKEWFGHEAEIHKRKLGAQQTGVRE